MKRMLFFAGCIAVGLYIRITQETRSDVALTKAIIVRFLFDNGIIHCNTTASIISPLFKRDSTAYADGEFLKAHEAKLVGDKNGNGILLESSYENLLLPEQALAKDASMFKAIGSERNYY